MVYTLNNLAKYLPCKICGGKPKFHNHSALYGLIYCENCNIEIKSEWKGEYISKRDLRQEKVMKRYELKKLYQLLLIWNRLMG